MVIPYSAVYTLWRYPDILPAFMTWPAVLQKLAGGAGKQCLLQITPRTICSQDRDDDSRLLRRVILKFIDTVLSVIVLYSAFIYTWLGCWQELLALFPFYFPNRILLSAFLSVLTSLCCRQVTGVHASLLFKVFWKNNLGYLSKSIALLLIGCTFQFYFVEIENNMYCTIYFVCVTNKLQTYL